MLNVEEEREGLKYIKETSLSGGRMVRLQTWMNIAFALLICAMIAGCYTRGGEDPGPFAFYAGTIIEPTSIHSTDTVKIRIILTHMHQRDIEYSWAFQDWSIVGGDTRNRIGTILNGKGASRIRPSSNYTVTDSATVYWVPGEFTGRVLVQFNAWPKSGTFEPVVTAFSFVVQNSTAFP
jgi:hypothetical protein